MGVFLVILSAASSHGMLAPCTMIVRMDIVPTKNTVINANLHKITKIFYLKESERKKKTPTFIHILLRAFQRAKRKMLFKEVTRNTHFWSRPFSGSFTAVR